MGVPANQPGLRLRSAESRPDALGRPRLWGRECVPGRPSRGTRGQLLFLRKKTRRGVCLVAASGGRGPVGRNQGHVYRAAPHPRWAEGLQAVAARFQKVLCSKSGFLKQLALNF